MIEFLIYLGLLLLHLLVPVEFTYYKITGLWRKDKTLKLLNYAQYMELNRWAMREAIAPGLKLGSWSIREQEQLLALIYPSAKPPEFQ